MKASFEARRAVEAQRTGFGRLVETALRTSNKVQLCHSSAEWDRITPVRVSVTQTGCTRVDLAAWRSVTAELVDT